MLKYTLFYLVFTTIVAVAVLFYCDKQETEAQESGMRLREIQNNYCRIGIGKRQDLSADIQKIRDKIYLQNIDTAYQNIPSIVKNIAAQSKRYTDNVAELISKKFILNEIEPVYFSKQKRLYKPDIEAHKNWRDTLKKYWQDTLLNENFLKNLPSKILFLNPQHEANMCFFYTNFNEYTTPEQYKWLMIDKLYWESRENLFLGDVLENLSEVWYKNEKTTKPTMLHAVMSPEKAPLSRKSFVNNVGIAEFVYNDKYLEYLINGQRFYPKNGVVNFDLPAGKASSNMKNLIISATLTNPATGQKNTVKSETKYKVIK